MPHLRCCDIQPQYFPRLHYLARILASDIYIVRDDAQFVRTHKYPSGERKASYQAHAEIKQSSGIQVLTVPTKHRPQLPLNETTIAYEYPWARKHVRSIQAAYGRAPNSRQLIPEVEELISCEYDSLADLNLATIAWAILRILGVKRRAVDCLSIDELRERLRAQDRVRLKDIRCAKDSTALADHTQRSASEKIVALCEEIGADEVYCGGTSVAAYLDLALLHCHGIKVTVQDWRCRYYRQRFEDRLGFIPNLSIVDLLMNVQVDGALRILAS